VLYFCIRLRAGASYYFYPELEKLTETSFLGSLIPEAVIKVKEFQGFGDLWSSSQHPDNRSGQFRTKRYLAVTLVLEI